MATQSEYLTVAKLDENVSCYKHFQIISGEADQYRLHPRGDHRAEYEEVREKPFDSTGVDGSTCTEHP